MAVEVVAVAYHLAYLQAASPLSVYVDIPMEGGIRMSSSFGTGQEGQTRRYSRKQHPAGCWRHGHHNHWVEVDSFVLAGIPPWRMATVTRSAVPA